MPHPAENEHDGPDVNAGDQRAQRVRKMCELRKKGIDPYGRRIDGITATAAAREAFEATADEAPDTEVRIAGRLTAQRVMGKSAFGDVRDESGRIQIYAQRNTLGDELYNIFRQLDLGDIITVHGSLFRTRMGEVTVRVNDFELLAKALRPLPEKWHGLTDVEQRYRQRYLDLTVNDDVRQVFRQRSRIIRELRGFFEDHGFLEVETPMLQPIPGGAAARPFRTHYAALDCPMYLRIAPELYLKRLLVGGFERVFELNRNFRNEGLSRRHNPEFTMIEAYQAYGDCDSMMAFVEEMIETVARRVLGTTTVTNADGIEIRLERPWRRVAYKDLIRERMGEDWYDLDIATKRRRATAVGLDITDEMDDAEVTHEIYEKKIEATLVQPTFVTRLPAHLVPLAKHCSDDPSLVDVYELEINGQEISPGYSELNDPLEQRRRFVEQAVRVANTVEAETGRIDQDFLVALEHGMPPAGGIGLGVDRLVMILTGAASIRDVILFPQMRPRKGPGGQDPLPSRETGEPE